MACAVIRFDRISIGSIDTCSGVFIGTTNAAGGWSSHRKSNHGFGQASDSVLRGVVSVVYDQDAIDSPIDDRDTFVLADSAAAAAVESVAFSDIHVNALGTNAAISVGRTQQNGWSAHAKTNLGEGGNSGVNLSAGNQSVISDQDYVDAPIQSNAYFTPR